MTADLEVRVLTIRQPWAWAICQLAKTVENRTWPTSYRGPILIHAARQHDPRGFRHYLIQHLARKVAELAAALEPGLSISARIARLLHPDGHVRGAVVASAQLVDVHADVGCCGAWADRSVGRVTVYHWVLTDVRTLPVPIGWRGLQGLWRAPEALLRHVGDLRPTRTVEHTGGLL